MATCELCLINDTDTMNAAEKFVCQECIDSNDLCHACMDSEAEIDTKLGHRYCNGCSVED